jgi:predicted PurR-regulated permease PerM
MPKKIEISHKTIIFTVAFLIFLWFVYSILDVLLALFVAIIIMAVLDPMVTKLSQYNIPRSLSVLVTYALVLVFIGVIIAAVVPELVRQTTEFVNNFPRILENLGITLVFSEQMVQQILNQLGTLPAQLTRFIVSLFSNILAVVTIFVFAFYLLVDKHRLDKRLENYLGEERAKKFAGVFTKLEKSLGGWARAQLTLMIAVGLLSYAGYSLLGIPFALPLAILMGLLEIIPYAGPLIASVPAVIIGFGISPIMGLAIVALIFLIQQLESYVLTPKIMQRTAGVNPIVTLLALTIGFRLGGILGLIISVPVFLTVKIILKEYYSAKH